MKKKFLIGLLVTSMTVMLAACGGGSSDPAEETPAGDTPTEEAGEASADGEDITIAAVYKTLSAEYWKAVEKGARDAAEELGINFTALGPNAESEIAQQVTMIEEQLSAGVDAIIVAPTEENAVIGALQGAVGEIPIIAVDTDFDLEGRAAFIGTGNVVAAKLGGVYAAELMGEGGKAILIGGQQGEETSAMRLQGFREGLEENGCTVLEEQFGNNTADKALAVMEDLLTKYPGEIGAVLAMNDDMAIGAQQAIENAGVEGIHVIGFNGDVGAVELIIDGKIAASVAQQPYVMGYQGVMQAYKAAKGEEIEPLQEVPANLITPDNAQAYLDDQANM